MAILIQEGLINFHPGSPEILFSGKGSYIFDLSKKKYLDYGMGLRSVNIGYADRDINQAVINAINLGNNLTLPTKMNLRQQKKFTNIIPSADMVKFTNMALQQ